MYTDFDWSPAFFTCNSCENKISFYGAGLFDDSEIKSNLAKWIPFSGVNDVPLLKENKVAQGIILNKNTHGVVPMILSHECECKCGESIQLTLWAKIRIKKSNQDYIFLDLEAHQILDGDNLSISGTPGFYRGVDIASALEHLYLRWWFLNGEIYVFCPFIGKSELQYLESIGQSIISTQQFSGSLVPSENPFKRIITRRNIMQNFKHVKFDALVSEFTRENPPAIGLQYVLDKSLFLVENKYDRRSYGIINEHHRSRKYFHGKFYGSKLKEKSECVITSYNYTVQEKLQLESFSISTTGNADFDTQVYKFLNDSHMKISKYTISD